ncbi:unnamed protein product [Mucor hiemalis]
MEQFNEVAIKMKKGNYSNFTLDLKRRLLDLQFTESTVSKQQKPALSIQAIKQAITATQLMIDTLEYSIGQINQSEKTHSSSSSSASSTSSTSSSLKEKGGEHSPKDYTPQCIDTLYPVPHFEKKLRSLAQLCQEPNEDDDEEGDRKVANKKCHMKKPSLTQKTAKMIPLVFSIIGLQQHPNDQNGEQQDEQEQLNESSRPTFAYAIKHDMYSEAIDSIQDMTRHFGKSSVILDVDEEEKVFIDPLNSAITFGRTFMMNMDNPRPRVDEREVESELKSDIAASEKTKDNRDQHNDKIEAYSFSAESDRDEANDDDLYYDIELAATQLWNSDKTPSHLLDVLKKYQSLIVDVIFSLMTGRTVLIQGSEHNKEDVKEVVRALSVFVPGQRKDRHQIIDWFDRSRLTDAEIGSIKLVGIDKQNMDPSIHIEGSCVLDIDVKNGSLNSSPVYVEGQWINQLLDRILLFSSDQSYIAYLHTVFMTMSLKAFIYHHLYVCDEFRADDVPTSASTASNVNKGYASETGSESSTLSRKWSVRLMSYLKKHEDLENINTNTTQEKISRPPSRASTASTISDSKHSTHTDVEEENYSDENQATVTLQNLLKNSQEKKPRTIVGLFGSTSAGEPVTATTNATVKSISTTSRRNSSDSGNSSISLHDMSDDEGDVSSYNLKRPPISTERSFLNFGAEDLECFGGAQLESSSEESSLSEVEDEPEKSKTSRRSRKDKHRRPRKLSDVGPDGVSYTERRGRRYLQEKLKVYGDDQTIVVYLATCVL